jgi:Protein of unknown function (DUF1619)
VSLTGEVSNDSDFSNFVVGIQQKFSLNTNLNLNITNPDTFQNTTFDQAPCTCDNLLLEAHYTVYYEPLSGDTDTSFKVSNITVDVVYGTYNPQDCNETVKLSRKTSWSFKRSIFSRKNSGGPGYVKGNKILTGDLKGEEKGQAI